MKKFMIKIAKIIARTLTGIIAIPLWFVSGCVHFVRRTMNEIRYGRTYCLKREIDELRERADALEYLITETVFNEN